MLREAAAFEVSLSNQSKEIQEPVGDEEDENPSKKAKVLSSEERAQINREKNREHARKTRQRKKIFVAKLKEMVDTMTQLKESQRRERIELGKRIAETVNRRWFLPSHSLTAATTPPYCETLSTLSSQ